MLNYLSSVSEARQCSQGVKKEEAVIATENQKEKEDSEEIRAPAESD